MCFDFLLDASKVDKKTLKRMTMKYYIDKEILHKLSFDGFLLRCLDVVTVKKVLQEIQ
jgi:hypothetical protein